MTKNTVGARIERLQAGDSHAAQSLWEQYFDRLTRLAQRRLKELPRRAADEEDIALSAMNSFVQGARAGRFPNLASENDLWRLLVTITTRKVGAQRRRHYAQRRDQGRVRGESIFQGAADGDEGPGIAGAAGPEPTPEFAALVAEQCRVLFEKLDDPLLRDVARWKMEGYSSEEIAGKLGRTVRTVERKLNLIRDCWSAD